MNIIPLLELRKQKYQEGNNSFVKGHTATKRQNWDLSPGGLAAVPMLVIPLSFRCVALRMEVRWQRWVRGEGDSLLTPRVARSCKPLWGIGSGSLWLGSREWWKVRLQAKLGWDMRLPVTWPRSLACLVWYIKFLPLSQGSELLEEHVRSVFLTKVFHSLASEGGKAKRQRNHWFVGLTVN